MRQNTPLEPARRAPDLYAEGLAHQVNAPLLLIVLFPCVNEENTPQYRSSFVFMNLQQQKRLVEI